MILMTIPSLTSGYIEFCSGVPLTFTIKRFTDDPQLISFLISINTLFNFLVSTTVAYVSDHIWTRWGRRRVFLVPGWTVLAICLAFIPFANTLSWLIVLIVIYQFSQDFGSCTVQPLNMEIVPPPQRSSFQRNIVISGGLAGLFYNLVLLAQFDHTYDFALGDWHLKFTGEQVVYWMGSFFITCVVLFVSFFVKEVRPPVTLESKNLSPMSFFKDAYGTRQFQYMFLLCLGVTITTAGMATNTLLLFTDQFGYTKAAFGQVQSINFALNICLFAPFFGWLGDRVPRMTLTKIGIMGVWCTNMAYFLYIRLLAPDGVPPMFIVIAFSVLTAIFFSAYVISHAPNVADHLESHQFGTFAAALNLPNGFLLFLLPNLYGSFVKWHGHTFLEEGKYDYTVAYFLNFALGLLGLSMIYAFAHCVKTGRIKPEGKLEWEKKRDAEAEPTAN